MKTFVDNLMGILNGSILGLFLGLSSSALISLFTSSELNCIHHYALLGYIISTLCLAFLLLIQEKVARIFIAKSESNRTASYKTNLLNARTDSPRNYICFIVLSVIFIFCFPLSLYLTNLGNQRNNKESTKKELMATAKIEDINNQLTIIEYQLDSLNQKSKFQVIKLDSITFGIFHDK